MTDSPLSLEDLERLEATLKARAHLFPFETDEDDGLIGPPCEDGMGRYCVDWGEQEGEEIVELLNSTPALIALARLQLSLPTGGGVDDPGGCDCSASLAGNGGPHDPSCALSTSPQAGGSARGFTVVHLPDQPDAFDWAVSEDGQGLVVGFDGKTARYLSEAAARSSVPKDAAPQAGGGLREALEAGLIHVQSDIENRVQELEGDGNSNTDADSVLRLYREREAKILAALSQADASQGGA